MNFSVCLLRIRKVCVCVLLAPSFPFAARTGAPVRSGEIPGTSSSFLSFSFNLFSSPGFKRRQEFADNKVKFGEKTTWELSPHRRRRRYLKPAQASRHELLSKFSSHPLLLLLFFSSFLFFSSSPFFSSIASCLVGWEGRRKFLVPPATRPLGRPVGRSMSNEQGVVEEEEEEEKEERRATRAEVE